MLDKRSASQPKALATLTRLREQLAEESPAFAAAAILEQRAALFSERTRDRMRARRKELQWEQSDLAKAMDYSQPGISKIESGQTEMNLKTLYRMARALGLQPVMSFVPSASAMKRRSDELRGDAGGRIIEMTAAVEGAQEQLLDQMHQVASAVAELVRADVELEQGQAVEASV